MKAGTTRETIEDEPIMNPSSTLIVRPTHGGKGPPGPMKKMIGTTTHTGEQGLGMVACTLQTPNV